MRCLKLQNNLLRVPYMATTAENKAAAHIPLNRTTTTSLETQVQADIRFIRKIKDFPLLYNTTLRDFRDPVKKRNAWRVIAKAMWSTPHECQHRWKNLRERYVKEKKWRMFPHEDSSVNKTPWELYEAMSFLSPFVKHRNSRYLLDQCNKDFAEDDQALFLNTSNPAEFLTNSLQSVYNASEGQHGVSIKEGPKEIAIVTKKMEPKDEEAVLPVALISNMCSESAASSGQLPPKKQKLAESQHLEKRIIETIERRFATLDHHRDEEDLFALSIAHTLRRLPPKKKALAKLKIQTILYELQDDE